MNLPLGGVQNLRPGRDLTDLHPKGPNAGKNDGLNIYAVNYNVLRIMSGMGGLAYSN